jgi:hypothetical protein
MRSDALWYSDHFSSGILVYLGNKRAFAIGDHLLRLYELIRIVTRVYGPYEFDGSLDELIKTTIFPNILCIFINM